MLKSFVLTRHVRPSLLHVTTFPSRHLLSFSTLITDNSPLISTDKKLSNLSIHVTPAEDSLFSFLEYIQRLYTPKTQLRVAGGWIRDKLRGCESKDIDIVLDNLKGATFARYITKFQRSRRLPLSSVGVVKANSERSKHLEVATVKVEGFTIDFVHLRKEDCKVDNCNSKVTFASPEDDANRRDLTINALFFNLHTRLVEDFTGKGVEDIEKGIIRTPKEPKLTFLDDPLRVLRALRFACEFGFTLDPALEHVVLEQREIAIKLALNVSRERIGIEVRKMLAGKDPTESFELLRKFHLLDLVFNNLIDKERRDDGISQCTPREWTESIQKRALHCLKYLQHSRLALAKCAISNVEATAAIFTPLFLRQPAGKRVALIIEAIATYPETFQDVQGLDAARISIQHCIQQFIWMTKYHSVIVPALTILVSTCTFEREIVDDEILKMQEKMLKAYLDMAKTYARINSETSKRIESQRQRLDGKTIQERFGLESNHEIAKILNVLQVWEKIHPNASIEEKIMFVDRLRPQLRSQEDTGT
ncbi:trna nucleotidyltransferase poly polymerase [Plasmopara halstedii]|uniref:Trna nucleotidyltransferase poly polymerase n=1 Tax=Plasmopara halstedii TaxID=4781 RepID=A0A0P1ASY9_PLAHL|nr:trna nucleotidyltransferase poly polymerase [Plasmopara halstedii]CEG45247.1 trna nucleotidyltransferase poly polymerase [Plasmopara halstedii]|eukprot:XP_024581616.1 trna nucleotidyltransferase poly polymerase [Plasmopara halstedii]